jgi:predicted MFS family arabinose efflux permease
VIGLMFLHCKLFLLTKELQNNIKGWVDDVKRGGVFVWRHLLLRIVTTLTVVWLFCNIVFLSQLTIFLKHILPGEPRVLGYVLGLEGLGAVLTGAILSRYKSISNCSYYFFAAFCLIGLGTLGIGCYQTSWLRLFLYISPFVLGLGSGIGMVVQGYLIRKESPEKQLGCVFGISSATQNISLAAGTLLGGLLVMQFGTREVYIGLAATMLLLGISAFLLLKNKAV